MIAYVRPTHRQREVIADFIETGSMDETAARLGITPGAVRHHLDRARRRGAFRTNEQLVYAGARDGWIAVPQRATNRRRKASEG